jgi:hypothetical protein
MRPALPDRWRTSPPRQGGDPEGAYRIGEEITVADVRAPIAAIEATGTVLDTAEGERVRVPNSQLIAGGVRLHGADRTTENRRPQATRDRCAASMTTPIDPS